MGYACPVCDVPQRDAEHLANHLAFTAMLRHEEHEAWLDEQIPNWSECGPKELAEVVPDHAEETEYDEVFEDTVGSTHHDHDHQHGHDHAHGSTPGGMDPSSAAQRGSGSMSAEAQQVLQEAQELTQQMLETDESESADDAGGAGDADSATEPEADDSDSDEE
ncbi:hypothetical protein AUR64_13415 [Haloprofundus marisrubri]|uniref:Uncharacterized protein n=1 Tax=Haloprofundus marisrubri TaxID=1514971 RepID=A0A0W1R5Y9_9EURY|nr:DUF5810 domain-containing protein [Haloprofundus marisrubri]KTG08813.1 hypothetical protein AUR64_13415 [Haloprofundus marisrubri]